MLKGQIKPSLIICLLIATVGGILIFSIEEPQEDIIDFPIPEGESIAIYYNPEGSISWEQIQTTERQEYFLHYYDQPLIIPPETNSQKWIRIPLENSSNKAQHFCLELAAKWIDLAQLYTPLRDGSYITLKTGETVPYSERGLPSRRPAFPITLEPNSKSIHYLLLEEESDVYTTNIKLWNSMENFNRMLLTENKRISFHFGLYGAIFLFSTIAYLVIQSRDLLYYLIYVFWAGIIHVGNFNLQAALFPFTLIDGAWLGTSFLTTQALSSGFFTLFTLEFLKTSKHFSQKSKVLYKLIWLYICIAPLWMLGVFNPMIFIIGYKVVLGGGIALTFICFLTAIISTLQKNYPAVFYVLAYLIYTITQYRLFISFMIDVEPPSIYGVQFLYGSSLEMIILTVALSGRFLSIRNAKEQAQQKAYTEAIALNKLQQSYTESLQKEVDDQTAELNLMNQRKDQLFRLVGDNLRAPLQEVTLLSETIEHIDFDKPYQAFRSQAQSIWLTSFNLLNHLENLLKWARLKIKTLSINPAEYALIDLIDPLLEKYQLFVDENRIAVHKNIDKNLSIHADQDLIAIVFRNLIACIVTSQKSSDYINITAFERNARVCVNIEYASVHSESNKTGDLAKNPKRHFSIQLCQQLLELNNSKLVHKTINKSQSLFEFDLQSKKVIC